MVVIFFLGTRRRRRQLDYERFSESVRHGRVVRLFSAPSHSLNVGHLPDIAMYVYYNHKIICGMSHLYILLALYHTQKFVYVLLFFVFVRLIFVIIAAEVFLPFDI